MSFTTNGGAEGTEYDDRNVLTRQEEDVESHGRKGDSFGGTKAR